MLTRALATLLFALLPTLVSGIEMRSGQPPTSVPLSQQSKTQSDRIRPALRGFTVEVTLSEKARQRMAETKETIAGTGYFTASPQKGIPLSRYRRFLSRPGPLGLGYLDVEAKPTETTLRAEISS
jgi:hypothetical protein